LKKAHALASRAGFCFVARDTRPVHNVEIIVVRAYRYAIGEAVFLTHHRASVTWKAEYVVVGHITPGDLELRYLIQSTNRSAERTAREHELSRAA
jgi:hypothetical protein